MSDAPDPGATNRDVTDDGDRTRQDITDDGALTRDDIRGLRGDTAELIGAIKEMVASQTRPVKWAVGIVAVVLVACGITAFVFYNKVDNLSKQNADLAQELNDNAVVACEGGNDRLHDQLGMWLGLVVNSTAETPEEQHAFDLIVEHAHKVYKARDCDHLDVPYEPAGDFPDLGLN